MGANASQITSLTMLTQLFIQSQIKENIKAPRHWPLLGEFSGDWWIPDKGPVTRKMISFDDVIMDYILALMQSVSLLHLASKL